MSVWCQGAGISQAGRHETDFFREVSIRQLPCVKLTNLSARGLVKLGFGDIVTDDLRPKVADRGLLNVKPFL